LQHGPEADRAFRAGDRQRDACICRHARPAQALLDYLEGGETIADFLEDFPIVFREQAIAFLEEAGRSLLARIG
jgi:uncharacterized protein (DUF433 family)